MHILYSALHHLLLVGYILSMRILVVLILFLHALNICAETSQERCAPQSPLDKIIYSDDFFWNMSATQMSTIYNSLYYSKRRLNHRAYFKGDHFVLPLNQGDQLGEVKVTDLFIKSVTRHVEVALKRKYAEYIFFPDMGHSHFFVPLDYYNRELRDLPYDSTATLYEKMLAHPDLKILYHTAEQLKMKEANGEVSRDRQLAWRFFSRNIVGDNQGKGQLEVIYDASNSGNTVHEYQSDFYYWGAGFNISANQNGCFPFEVDGKIYYFDLSLSDLEHSESDTQY